MKDARLEFTCTPWGCVIPPHDSPIAVRPKTSADADQQILVLELVLKHMKEVRATLPVSADITGELASLNQVVELPGVSLSGVVGRIG